MTHSQQFKHALNVIAECTRHLDDTNLTIDELAARSSLITACARLVEKTGVTFTFLDQEIETTAIAGIHEDILNELLKSERAVDLDDDENNPWADYSALPQADDMASAMEMTDSAIDEFSTEDPITNGDTLRAMVRAYFKKYGGIDTGIIDAMVMQRGLGKADPKPTPSDMFLEPATTDETTFYIIQCTDGEHKGKYFVTDDKWTNDVHKAMMWTAHDKSTVKVNSIERWLMYQVTYTLIHVSEEGV